MKKSFMARICALYLKLFREKPDREKTREIMESKLQAGETEYRLKKSLSLKSDIAAGELLGMKYYTLNYNSKTDKTIIYFHGGAYVNNIEYFHWRFILKLSEETGHRIIVPIYPLAPYNDFKDCYRLASALCEKYCSDDAIFIGDSAGGALCLGLWMYQKENRKKEPQGAIVFSPWVDIGMSDPDIESFAGKDPFLNLERLEVCAEYWAKGEDMKDYRLSPVYGDVSSLKNVTLFVGTDEIICPDVLRFYDRIKDNRNCRLIVGEGMNHVYPLFPIPEAKKAFRDMIDIINDMK